MENNHELVAASGGENLAETLAREIKEPIRMLSPDDSNEYAGRHLLLPPGWKHEVIDDARFMSSPRRAQAKAVAEDVDSFLAYVSRHGTQSGTTVWCKTDTEQGHLRFTAILNDHDPLDGSAGWRDHICTYEPMMSVEWRRWKGQDRKSFNQVEFASFVEDNLADIASVEGMPTGSQMLEMALSMEATQDVRFKSAIRLSNGGVQLQFVQDDDAQTLARMQLFERFAIGIPVFWNAQAYRMNARLRYRVRDGKVSFWFELERPDQTFEAAAKTLIESVRQQAGVPFFFGAP